MPEQAFYVVAQAVACALLSEDAAALPAATRVLAMLEADLYGGANDRDDGEPDAAANESFF
jgi:NADPH-dependent ferric siderophore reductase